MLNPSREELNAAEAFSKKVMGQAFDNKMTAVSLLIAAEALKYSAMNMIQNGDDAQCDCPDCKQRYRKMEMN